ncbi:MAG TPA: amino acid dehydrogenase, partial [Hyphomonadaceae bacterium]|nr:amino acid dehydrogenase [Hyphomonadaceae bacterium]
EKRIATLLREAEASLPKAADFRNVQSVWAGLRPMTPDSNPRMGRPHAALAYNLGHGMLGWTMGMGTAERLAKLIGLPELAEI